MTKSLDWGVCSCCGEPLDFRGYCTSKTCDYRSRFQEEDGTSTESTAKLSITEE